MRSSLLLAVVSLTACATIDAAGCREPYDVGFRDGIFGLQRQEELYQAACSRDGGQLNTARYVEGWTEGKYEFDRRKAHGGVE